jgi:hypothetical protein
MQTCASNPNPKPIRHMEFELFDNKRIGLDSKQLDQGDIFNLDLNPLQNMTRSTLEMLGRHKKKDVKELVHQQELYQHQ